MARKWLRQAPLRLCIGHRSSAQIGNGSILPAAPSWATFGAANDRSAHLLAVQRLLTSSSRDMPPNGDINSTLLLSLVGRRRRGSAPAGRGACCLLQTPAKLSMCR
ncbi:hypothetical protein M441DRAFT_455095 [Trichoderma asperellum CBS 433.97]|uniref:Uncharacterized protein n=1 Tax=Trichoderma asperellum (strain ATCC 204424 / CBS 433.97 / NBRC 101777) TaxID=1042311 RepID=A0A2T3ZEF9_TRIA4|nr:hypothetical protein M441DRAFT_455095 [Trichoderma asperellum CBS 433.97]PTB43185.1 hypothetical protein M441DRAFT_455095 [Trichoderma asperellum CBS 433.97]